MSESLSEKICFRLTRKCNLSCKFCLASNQINDLELNLVQKAINFLKQEGMKCIRLTGGEPTIRKDLIEIIQYCLDLELKVILCSNLYNIDNIFYNLIKLPIEVTTSLHGRKEYHNYITESTSYTNIHKNILKLMEAGLKVNVHSVLTRDNYLDAESFIREMINIGVKKITFHTLIPREKGIKMEIHNEDIEKILSLITQYMLTYDHEIKIKIINLYEKFYYVFEPDGYLYLQKENEENDEIIRRII